MSDSLEEVTNVLGDLVSSYWGQRIVYVVANRNGIFTTDDKNAAGDWRTCAVGLLNVPMNEEGGWRRPVDKQLDDLGRAFNNGVRFNEPLVAAHALKDICERVAAST